MVARIFIDGEAGTTGLQIRERLVGRRDIEVISIDPDKRKDLAERQRLLNAADVAILCLPDDAARESVSLIENDTTRVIDASTAFRIDPDWAYGFAEMDKGQADKIASAQVYYEKYGFSGRVAYTYHSAYLDTDGGLNVSDASGKSDGYFGALSTVDAKVAYKVTKQFEVFAEANNLNNATDYYFFQNHSRFREAESYGRSYRFGLSFSY